METVFLSGQPHLYMRLFAAPMVILLILLAAGTGAAIPPSTAVPDRGLQADAPTRPTTIEIELEQNGDAHWNVTTRFPLSNENETEAFRQVAEDFESGGLDTEFSTDIFETIAERASERTGREMRIVGVNQTSNVTNETGRLTLSFTWTNFAATANGRIMLGDVFELESGTWLSELTDEQRLVIRPPDSYVAATSPEGIGVDNGTIDINGSQSFAESGFRVKYVKSQTPATEQGTLSGLDWSQLPVVVVLLMAMGVGGLGVYVWSRRRTDPGDAVAGERAASSPPMEPGKADGGATTGNPEPDDEAREELLSDEERVERLIAENGGRMMQANIVKETNWSNAKVSQLLSSMDEEGRIDKLRIGRENLITFPDEDVTDVK